VKRDLLRHRVLVDPVDTLHKRLVCRERAFVHVLDFVFAGLEWRNPWQWDCEIFFDIPRTRLGFSNGERPGDIDMLVIPCVGRRRMWEEATAIEVKAYGLSRERRGKSVGDTGREQVIGLVNMGFPYVGLLHVVPVEPGAGEELKRLPLWHTDKPYPAGSPPEGFVLTDTSAMTFFLRQKGRMDRVAVPECAGMKVFAMTLDANRQIIGTSVGYERAPIRNPKVSDELIGKMPAAVVGAEAVRVGYPRPRFRARIF
jgi:hypothetical protein